MGVRSVPSNRGPGPRPFLRSLRLSSIAAVLSVSVIAAFWLGFIWLAALDRDDALDDAGDNLKAFAESYAEYAAMLARSGLGIPLGEREVGVTPAATPAAAALDSFHAVAQPDEGIKVTIRRLAPGSEGTASQYTQGDPRWQYRYIGSSLFAAAQRPAAGIEIIAEEPGVIEGVEDWQDYAVVEIVVLGILTALIALFAFWFVGYLRAHEAMQAQNARLQAKLRQAEKMQAIGTMSAGVAHELNNLLQPIIMMTELVLTELPKESKNVTSLHRVVDAGTKAADIVQRILAFGRADEVSHHVVNIGLVVLEGCSFIRTILPSTITLHVDIDDTVLIRGDKTQLTQVLINLATNARDAVGANVGEIWVTLSRASVRDRAANPVVGTLAPGDHAVLTVRDTGIGMTRTTVERIFEPFFTTKTVGKGTGLGLSVTHGIVVGHSGAVLVDSAPGRGTSISVYFPLAEKELPIALAS